MAKPSAGCQPWHHADSVALFPPLPTHWDLHILGEQVMCSSNTSQCGVPSCTASGAEGLGDSTPTSPWADSWVTGPDRDLWSLNGLGNWLWQHTVINNLCSIFCGFCIQFFIDPRRPFLAWLQMRSCPRGRTCLVSCRQTWAKLEYSLGRWTLPSS
jgi:hypothetical protein